MKPSSCLVVATFLLIGSCIEPMDSIPIPDIESIEADTFNPYIKVSGIVQMSQALEPVIEETSYAPIGEQLDVKIYMDSVIYLHGPLDFAEGLLVSGCREDTMYYDAVTDTSIVYLLDVAFWECLAANSCDPLDEVFYFEIVAR